MHHVRRRSVLALAAATLAASIAGPVFAVRPAADAWGTYFQEVQVRGRCLRVYDGVVEGRTVTFKQRRGGTLIATRTATASPVAADACLKTLLPGDVVTASIQLDTGLAARSITIPEITVAIDPAADAISGRISDTLFGPGMDLSFRAAGLVYDSIGFGATLDGTDGSFKLYSATTAPAHDIRSGDVVSVRTNNVNATDSYVRTVALPAAWATVGSAVAGASGKAGVPIKLQLRTKAGVLRATAGCTVLPGDTDCAATFRTDGALVKARVGDRLTASHLAGGLTLMKNTAIITQVDEFNWKLGATCFPDGRWTLSKPGFNSFWGRGDTPGDGVIVDGSAPGPVDSTRLLLGCDKPNGFGQRFKPSFVPLS